MSNIVRRESFRHHSNVSCTGVISGVGPAGSQLAIAALAEILSQTVEPA